MVINLLFLYLISNKSTFLYLVTTSGSKKSSTSAQPKPNRLSAATSNCQYNFCWYKSSSLCCPFCEIQQI